MKAIFIITIVLGVYTPIFSQWNDNFSDNEFTSSPEWFGNSSNFIVDGEILRLNAPAISGNSFLAIYSDISLEAEWTFSIKLDFNPSSSNYLKVYLMADSLDIVNSQNGYYIKIGGTPDEVSFYKISNGIESMLIDGKDDRVDLSVVEISVIITRSKNGGWELKNKLIDEVEFASEGTINDLDIQESTYFGFYCNYTSTRSTKFYFDDISVTGTRYMDPDPPFLVSTSTPESNQIQLVFNEEIDSLGSKNKTHYLLNDSINPSKVLILAVDTVLLEFASDLNLINSLELTSIPDLVGNKLDTIVQVLHINPAPYKYRDLVINEIFPDPNPQEDLPAFEFVELYNRSNRIIDLTGFQFTDGSKVATFEPHLIYPDSFVIVCAVEAKEEFEKFGITIGTTNWPALNNGEDALQLTDRFENIIDSLTYSLDWYDDPTKDNGGWSLEQINPNSTCLKKCNWKASIQIGGGTPGIINSVFDLGLDVEPPILSSISTPSNHQIKLVFNEQLDSFESKNPALYILNNSIHPSMITQLAPDTILLNFTASLKLSNSLAVHNLPDTTGNQLDTLVHVFYVDPSPVNFREVVINEIFPDPNPQEDLPAFEFVELYNRSNRIIDLSGFQFTDGSKVAIFEPYLIYPDSFVIVCAVEAKEEFEKFGSTIGTTNWPALNNGEDALQLTDRFENIIDSLTYSLDWYDDPTKDNGGWSLEQINPNSTCLKKCNWKASVQVGGGTPGIINSVFDLGLDEEPPVFSSISTPSNHQIKLVFNEHMDSLESKNAALYILNNSIHPSMITQLAPDTILLDFTASLNLSNSLAVHNLPDTTGNQLDTLVHVFYVDPSPVNFREVVINELFADPNPQEELPLYEFVELLNISDRIIDLNHWQFSDGSKTVLFGSQLLFPDSILILCSEEAVEEFQQYGKTMGLVSWPTLNNEADSLSLNDSSGRIIDSVYYSSDWYNDSKDEGGWSLEQINPLSNCQGRINWTASNSIIGGTPGNINSVYTVNTDFEHPFITQALATDTLMELWFSEPVLPNQYIVSIFPNGVSNSFHIKEPTMYISTILSNSLNYENKYTINIPLEDCNNNNVNSSSVLIPIASPEKGDIIINEVLFNPYSNGSDFIEVYNTSENNFNLKNYSIINQSKSTIKDTTLLLPPHSYLALSEDILFLKNQYLAPDSSLFETDLPSFSNDEGSVSILSYAGKTIDSVYYSEEYHFSLISDVEGISLERISTVGESTNKDNWRSAAETVGFATPGYKNSQSIRAVSQDSVSVFPEILTPNNDGQADFCQVNFQLDEHSQTINIDIYTINGHLVKTVASNAIIPSVGSFTWDGTDQQGRILPTAHYIIVSEVITSDGRVMNFRNKVVVANGF